MSTFRVLLKLTAYKRWLYPLNVALWAIWYLLPLSTGLIGKAFFDRLSDNGQAGLNEWTLIALLVVTGGAQILSFVSSLYWFFTWWYTIEALLRKNMLAGVLNRRAALGLPYSPGEAVSRFRDDVDAVLTTLDGWLDLLGQMLFTIVALGIMLTVNPWITLVVTLPIAVAIAIANIAGSSISKRRAASRKAAGRVAGFIGEIFGAVQAIKVSSATPHVTARFKELNEERGRTALRDRLLTEVLDTINFNTVDVAMGLMLLIAAEAMRTGSFTVGDFTLFAAYLPNVVSFPRWIGRALVKYRQTGISLDRMRVLLDSNAAIDLAEHGPVYTSGDFPEVRIPHRRPQSSLNRLEVQGLTYRHPGSGRGIRDASFAVEQGSLTVLTGRIGSGKTTLLHAMLGLLPKEDGEVFWNGTRIDDLAEFFQPPHSAYTPQSPRLFSETLRNNILLGRPDDERELLEALHTAVLDTDIPQLDHGLDTMIGPKGVKLSGGQAHRAAAARMLIREADLLVFDDLSSALDVDTERTLWDRLFARREFTCLVVSHRRAILERADQVIVLDDGTVDAQGTLEEVLRASTEMRLLWREEAVPITAQEVPTA